MNATTQTRSAQVGAEAWASARAVLVIAALIVLGLVFAPGAGAYLYWATGEEIGRANLDGTGVEPAFIPYPCCPANVAVDGTHIYWADSPNGRIGRANLDGTGAEQSFIAVGQPAPQWVAVDGAHIYWTNLGADTIGRASLDGTVVEHTFISANEPRGLAVDGAHIYWAGVAPLAIGDTIFRANLDGTNVDPTFITGASDPSGVAVDGAHVYWANQTNGKIGRANLDGTGVEQGFISGGQGTMPRGLAVDDAHVYWTNGGGNRIDRANLDGSDVDKSFIGGLGPSFGLAVDALPSGAPAPSNAFRFGKLNRNRENGTAKLTIEVPGPGELVLAKTGKVKRARREVNAAGSVKLKVKPRGTAKRNLSRSGAVNVEARVTFTPIGGAARTEAKPVRLIRRG